MTISHSGLLFWATLYTIGPVKLIMNAAALLFLDLSAGTLSPSRNSLSFILIVVWTIPAVYRLKKFLFRRSYGLSMSWLRRPY